MNFTEEELSIIKHALMLRSNVMLRDAETYKANHDVESVKDCMEEFRKTNKLYDKIYSLAYIEQLKIELNN